MSKKFKVEKNKWVLLPMQITDVEDGIIKLTGPFQPAREETTISAFEHNFAKYLDEDHELRKLAKAQAVTTFMNLKDGKRGKK